MGRGSEFCTEGARQYLPKAVAYSYPCALAISDRGVGATEGNSGMRNVLNLNQLYLQEAFPKQATELKNPFPPRESKLFFLLYLQGISVEFPKRQMF